MRSPTIVNRIPFGIARRSRGSCCLIDSTVSTMFAPGWRWMSNTTAGMPSYVAETRAFSTPAITDPTADSRTGAASRQAITRSL